MISMINKRSKKGVFLFEEIMNASDVKLIFLSGTPIINDPFEVAIIANLLTGFVSPKTGEVIAAPSGLERQQKKMLFGDNVDFYYYFVDSRDPDLPRLKNLMALKHRLIGTISYYAGLQPQKKILPEVTEHTHLIEMSPRQHELYEIVRKPERETEKKIRKRMANTAKAKKFGKATVNLEMMFRPEGRPTFQTSAHSRDSSATLCFHPNCLASCQDSMTSTLWMMTGRPASGSMSTPSLTMARTPLKTSPHTTRWRSVPTQRACAFSTSTRSDIWSMSCPHTHRNGSKCCG